MSFINRQKENIISKIWLLFSFIIFFEPCSGQISNRKYQKMFIDAKQLFEQGNYSKAENRCKKILEKNENNGDVHLLLADIYYEINNVEDEILHLNKALDFFKYPLIFYRLGNAYYSIEKYMDARQYYSQYVKKGNLSQKRRERVNQKIKSCQFAEKARSNPVLFKPIKLNSNINSNFDEYWPSCSIDQKQLVFTRLVHQQGKPPQEDFYFSCLDDGEWQKAKPIIEVNTIYNEGAQNISADGNFLFFTICNLPGGMGSCDIYYSIKKGTTWTKPINAGSKINSSGWEAQPCLSADNKYLYFSSNRAGGYGGKDIWRAKCLGIADNGVFIWEQPTNLGDSINSKGDEISPYIHAGNENFYFASNYHPGMGGFDMFMSVIVNDSIFLSPKNLGYPINTVKDEQGLHVSADGITAFFASSRDTVGGLDLYSFDLYHEIRPLPATYVKTKVYDVETKLRIQAKIELINLEREKKIVQIKDTDIEGEVLICLPTGNKYSFSVLKEGYLFYSDNFDLVETRDFYDPYELDVGLQPIKIGAEMNLYNVYFKTDSFNILENSEPELNKLVLLLNKNPGLIIEIQGHTDNTGSSVKNCELSKMRANAVKKYLYKNGINQKRINCIGFGEKKPVADNNTKEGRKLNRRTTIKILDQ